jgi:hypothetical protein
MVDLLAHPPPDRSQHAPPMYAVCCGIGCCHSVGTHRSVSSAEPRGALMSLALRLRSIRSLARTACVPVKHCAICEKVTNQWRVRAAA